MESSNVSIGLNAGQMEPVTATPAVQGQAATSDEDEEDRPRRRPPLPEEPPAESEPPTEETPLHRIDSLA